MFSASSPLLSFSSTSLFLHRRPLCPPLPMAIPHPCIDIHRLRPVAVIPLDTFLSPAPVHQASLLYTSILPPSGTSSITCSTSVAMRRTRGLLAAILSHRKQVSSDLALSINRVLCQEWHSSLPLSHLIKKLLTKNPSHRYTVLEVNPMRYFCPVLWQLRGCSRGYIY